MRDGTHEPVQLREQRAHRGNGCWPGKVGDSHNRQEDGEHEDTRNDHPDKAVWPTTSRRVMSHAVSDGIGLGDMTICGATPQVASAGSGRDAAASSRRLLQQLAERVRLGQIPRPDWGQAGRSSCLTLLHGAIARVGSTDLIRTRDSTRSWEGRARALCLPTY